MTFGAGEHAPDASSRDDAADASRFFSRVGYAVLGDRRAGRRRRPSARPLHLLPDRRRDDPDGGGARGKPGFLDRVLRAFRRPTFLALIAGLAWATLSVLWTPYPVSALQHALKLGAADRGDAAGGRRAARKRARHRPLSFPDRRRPWHGRDGGQGPVEYRRPARRTTAASGRAGSRSPFCCFPALGGLTARGRNGYARLLLILALAFAYIDSYAPLTVALFAGYLAMSFSISDLSAHGARTRLGRGGARPPCLR